MEDRNVFSDPDSTEYLLDFSLFTSFLFLSIALEAGRETDSLLRTFHSTPGNPIYEKFW